jgi:hypothetical protein
LAANDRTLWRQKIRGPIWAVVPLDGWMDKQTRQVTTSVVCLHAPDSNFNHMNGCPGVGFLCLSPVLPGIARIVFLEDDEMSFFPYFHVTILYIAVVQLIMIKQFLNIYKHIPVVQYHRRQVNMTYALESGNGRKLGREQLELGPK